MRRLHVISGFYIIEVITQPNVTYSFFQIIIYIGTVAINSELLERFRSIETILLIPILNREVSQNVCLGYLDLDWLR